jgi:adenylate cyclase
MSATIGSLLRKRYRLDAEIGRGGMGVVYRGHDTLLERAVAVKVLSETTLDSEGRARLLREAQAAAQLNHPNIASVHDAGEAEGVPFIVMELVEGPSLHEEPPEDLEVIVGLAGQVCAALGHAHAHGIVHRDLKPENVLLAPDGTAKLVDFGLARTVASRLTAEGAILGTLLYLAPEQAQGGEIDGRADLYALGVMLYEWTTGSLPFADAPPAVILSHHLHTPVVPPREHKDEIPPALDALIVQLLRKRPEERPVSAAEVRRALEALGTPATAVAPRELRGEPVRLPRFLLDEEEEPEEQRSAFVARERELAWLDAFLAEALEGNGRVAFVTGGPGRGKTALLDAFARQAMEAHPGLLVAGGTCNAYSGVGDAYLPFREMLGQLTGEVEARWAAGAIPGEQARRLWGALPATVEALLDHGPHVAPILVPGEALLARAEAARPDAPWLGSLRERVARDPAGSGRLEQSYLFQQVSNVLRALAEAHPLLLIVDDLQWVDRTSAGLLFHLGRRLEGSRILVVGAYRPEEVAPGRDGERHPLEKVLAELKRLYGDVWLDLAEVDEAEGRRFVDEFLETEPNRLGAGFRQALTERAGGHPLFTVELLRAMQARGDLVQDEAGRWVEGRALDWEALPARVEGVIAERIERLGTELREILRVASVEGEDFTAEVVGQVRSLETRALVRRLSGELQQEHRLVRAQGLRRLDGRRLALYRFQHHLFQKYLYNSLDEAERTYLHEDVGRVLEALYGEQTDEVAVQLARHFMEAGLTDKAAHYLGRAGEMAAERYANEEALAHLSKALEMAPEMDRAERFWLLLAREEVYDLLGDREAQRHDLAELETLGLQLGAEQKAEAANRRALYANSTGDYETAVAAARVVVEQARMIGNAGLQAQGHLRWGAVLAHKGDHGGRHAHHQQALSLARQAGLTDLEADVLSRLGAGARHEQGDVAAAQDYLEQALRLCRQSGNRWVEEGVVYELGVLAVEQADYVTAGQHFEQALHNAREMQDRWGELYALYGMAAIREHVGDYPGMRTYLEQAQHIAREIEEGAMEAFALSNLGMVRCCMGDETGAQEYAEKALHLAREVGDQPALSEALLNLGHLSRERGEPAKAQDYYEETLGLYRQSGEQHHAMEVLAGLASTALARSNMTQAISHAAEILAFLDGGGTLPSWGDPFWIRLTCYRVLEATGDPRASEFLQQTYDLLMEQADRIGDEGMRRSFLENVPWHREIVALAGETEDPTHP